MVILSFYSASWTYVSAEYCYFASFQNVMFYIQCIVYLKILSHFSEMIFVLLLNIIKASQEEFDTVTH